MKKLLLLFFAVLGCLTLSSQEEISDNLWGIDFHCFGTSFHYAGRIKNEYFLGVEEGFFPDVFDWVLLGGKQITERNTLWSNDRSEANLHELNQLLFSHVFIRWKPQINWFEIDSGFRWAGYLRSIPFEDANDFSNFLGVYVKPAIGYKKFKLGVRLEIGNISGKNYSRFNEFVIISSPFLRFNFR
jgi:hypothetical protein